MKYLNSAQRLSQKTMELTYVLIDMSISMDTTDYKPTRKHGAIQANIKLIETKSKIHPQDCLGIIGFDDNAHVLHAHESVGEGSQSLCRALRENTIGGGCTDFSNALKLAERCLFHGTPQKNSPNIFSRIVGEFLFEPIQTNSGHIQKVDNTGITRRIIMLTDGGHNGGGSPTSIAKRLKSAGVIIECIGIAGKRTDVDEDLLKQIASIDEFGSPRYSFINDTDNLIRKYKSMATHLRVPKGAVR